MTALAARRRHPLALVVLIALGLMATGALYAAIAPRPAAAAPAAVAAAVAATSASGGDDVAEGRKLFLANCASCHGLNAQGSPTTKFEGVAGPSLIGVGAAAVDFQVSTGRMPLSAPGPQAPQGTVKFSDEQVSALSAYIASLAPGPAIPGPEFTTAEGGDVANGGAIFRVNCAMCHNFAGAGGALTRGKYAPPIADIDGTRIYEAMLTGPQAMPVFNDANISPKDKRDVIAFIESMQDQSRPGGAALGNFGPVTEGLFAWIAGMGALIGCAVWLGAKAA